MTNAFTFWPAGDYDRETVTDARELATAHDADALRAYVARKDGNLSDVDSAGIYAAALGRAQAIIGILLRMGGADLLFPVPAEDPNPYEQAAARFEQASRAYQPLANRADAILQLANERYEQTRAELARHESKPGIPLPEYQTVSGA